MNCSLIISVVSSYSSTTHHYAVVGGRNNIVTFLLSHGARVNDVDKVS